MINDVCRRSSVTRRSSRTHAAALTAALIAIVPVIAAAPSGQGVYHNARFGFAVCYPPSLRPGREADDGDGRVFTGPGGGELRAYSELYTGDERTVARRQADEEAAAGKQGYAVTYRAHGPNWLALSGKGRGRIFYRKFVHRDDQWMALQVSYPEALAATWNPISAAASRCFR